MSDQLCPSCPLSGHLVGELHLSDRLSLLCAMRFNAGHAAASSAELTEIVILGAESSDEARSHALIAALRQPAGRVGIAMTLREDGISKADLDRPADDAMLQICLLVNNRKRYLDAVWTRRFAGVMIQPV